MLVTFLSGAAADLQAAFSRAEEANEGGGERLTGEIEKTLQLLKSHPEMGSIYEFPFRRLIVRRTFLAVYYSVTPTRILVQAVLDMRRDQAWIRARLRDAL